MDHLSLVQIESKLQEAIPEFHEFNKCDSQSDFDPELQILDDLISNSSKIRLIGKRKSLELFKMLNTNDTNTCKFYFFKIKF